MTRSTNAADDEYTQFIFGVLDVSTHQDSSLGRDVDTTEAVAPWEPFLRTYSWKGWFLGNLLLETVVIVTTSLRILDPAPSRTVILGVFLAQDLSPNGVLGAHWHCFRSRLLIKIV